MCFPRRLGSFLSACGRAAKGSWVLAPRSGRGSALSPRPVRGAAAGVVQRDVGEFTACAPPVPRRRIRAWNVGAERTARRAATRRARSARRERAEAWGSIGRIFGAGFRPTLASVCRLARIVHKNPLPGEPGVDFASAGSLVGHRPWQIQRSKRAPGSCCQHAPGARLI